MSKAEKMRGRLASIQRDREDFERQKKELEEQMNIGRQNMGKIKKGLKNNEIVEQQIFTEPSTASSSSGNQINNDHAPLPRKPSQNSNSNRRESNVSVNGSSSLNLQQHLLSPTASSVKGPLTPFDPASTAVIPSGPRVSDWCFTGGIDTSPPIVKNRELYENIRLLGRGSFGEVNLVKNVEDNKLFAIKTIFCAKDGDMQAVMHEVKFLRLSRHPCIIDIHDAFLMTNPRVMHIVMHYCESGSISTYITNAKKNKNSISEAQIIKWTIQLSLALHFMHEFNHTLHRDLKPMNVMLTEGGDLVKLCDFGLALNMDESNKEGDTNDEAGTPYYTAPEMIKGESYSYPADCWSFGVILYQLLTLERPFDGNNTGTLVKSILSDEPPGMPAHYSEDIKAICFGLLAKNPTERVSMSQLLADPFMYSKGSSFPSTYRPKAIEERIRRSHVKTLEHQLERVTRQSQKSIVAVYKEHLLMKSQQAVSPIVTPVNASSPMPSDSLCTPSGKMRKVMSHGDNIPNIVRENSNGGIGFSKKYTGHVSTMDDVQDKAAIENTSVLTSRTTDTESVNGKIKNESKVRAFESIDPVALSSDQQSGVKLAYKANEETANRSQKFTVNQDSASSSSADLLAISMSPINHMSTSPSLPHDSNAFSFDSPSPNVSSTVIHEMEEYMESEGVGSSSKHKSPVLPLLNRQITDSSTGSGLTDGSVGSNTNVNNDNVVEGTRISAPSLKSVDSCSHTVNGSTFSLHAGVSSGEIVEAYNDANDISLCSVDCEDVTPYRENVKDSTMTVIVEEESGSWKAPSNHGGSGGGDSSPLNSSINSQTGGRKGLEIAKAKETDVFYEAQLTPRKNGNV